MTTITAMDVVDVRFPTSRQLDIAKRSGKPLWKLLADMTPEELVALVDWRYLADVLRPDEATDHATR